ncbi:aminoacyl-tRNA hydrolase [Patescibacteria group bacterium]|nr:aminoacyl-tRNA hydrolase [Patescibacteria group bacterium]
MLKQKNNNTFLVVGLGNPWEKYKNTRHNIGARVVDCFAKENKFSDFDFSKKFNCLISKKEFKEKEIILAKPQTFMNNSGSAVKTIMSNVKCQMSNVWIIHDDLDIDLGKIKIVKNCGSAGHKGIESIIDKLKTKNFIRIRVGIKPESKKINIKKFVLEKFNEKEEEIIKQVAKKVEQAIEMILEQGLPQAMNTFNRGY